MIPALKSTVAAAWDDGAWARVRPPLTTLEHAEAESVAMELKDAGFTFGG
jgi:hypothetical protein